MLRTCLGARSGRVVFRPTERSSRRAVSSSLNLEERRQWPSRMTHAMRKRRQRRNPADSSTKTRHGRPAPITLSAIRGTRRTAEAASSRGRATMGELVRFADVLGRRLSNAVGKDDPQPAPPIERPPEPVPEPLRDPNTPQPVKSPPPEKPPEPVPELPTNATSAALATAA